VFAKADGEDTGNAVDWLRAKDERFCFEFEEEPTYAGLYPASPSQVSFDRLSLRRRASHVYQGSRTPLEQGEDRFHL
jgi:hypothetical protein